MTLHLITNLHDYLNDVPELLQTILHACLMLCAFVFVQILRMSERLTTHVTPEWLLTCVNTFVSVKNTGPSKSLTTHITPEWLLT